MTCQVSFLPLEWDSPDEATSLDSNVDLPPQPGVEEATEDRREERAVIELVGLLHVQQLHSDSLPHVQRVVSDRSHVLKSK